jgi:hypothetical protein
MISSASPMQNTIRGARKWLSVSAALIFSEVDIGRMDSSKPRLRRTKTIIGDQRSISKAGQHFYCAWSFFTSPPRREVDPGSPSLVPLAAHTGRSRFKRAQQML